MKSHVPEDAGSDQMISFLDKVDGEGKSARDAWLKGADKWVDLYRGRGSIRNLKPDPLFSVDLLSSAINRKNSLLSEGKPIYDVMPRRPGLDNTAIILKDTSMGVWDQQEFPMTNDLLMLFGAIMGCAGIRTRWDKDYSYGFGDITLSAVDPRNIVIDPAVTQAHEIYKGQYVRIDSVVPTGILARKYPKFAGQLKGDTRVKPDVSEQRNRSGIWNAMNLFRGASDRTQDAVPRSRLREYWLFDPTTDDDGLPKYPNGRYLLRAEDNLILNPDDDENPYFDGMFDLDLFDNHPDPDHPFGRSEVEALQFLQSSFNSTGKLIVKSFLRNGYPWVVADRGALDTDTIQQLRDAEQMVLEKGGGREVQRTAGPLLGQEAMSMMQLIMQLAFQQEGLTDPGMEGRGRVELRSGSQLEGLQTASQLIVRAQARRLEQLYERVGQKIISRIFQFYDDDRMLTYYGGGEAFLKYTFERKKLVSEIIALGVKRALDEEKKSGELMTEGRMADHILLAIKGAWKGFSFRVIPYSSMQSTRQQRALMKMQLVQAGMLPSSEILREVGYSDPQQQWERAAEEHHQRMALGLDPPPAPPKGGGKKK